MFNTTVKFALIAAVAAAFGGQLLARNAGSVAAVSQAAKPQPAGFATAGAPPKQAVQAAAGERAELFADSAGHFHASVEVEYRSLNMLVDTGASIIALTYDDADRLGVRPDTSGFRMPISTANGTAYAAAIKLRSVSVSGIRIYDVDAVVMPRGALSQSLLGMSYLKRLAAFEVGNGRLVLRR